jgi:hypothetical protein
METTHAADGTPRRTIASFDRYEDAQALVDRLSDQGFPVEHLAIVGRDLRTVERVTGRLDAWRAVLLGGASGALLGLFFGLLFGLLFTPNGISLATTVIYWLVVGMVVGGLFKVFTYFLSGGRRDFTSVLGVEAARYDVLADDEVADDAIRRVATAPSQQTSTAG